MYTAEFLETLKQAEARLAFETFDQEDAYVLGTRLREAGLAAAQPVAVRVVLDGLIVYQSFPNGTGSDNNAWMDRKYATVIRARASSLRAAAERELLGPREPWQSDEEHHAFCGGGFPIVVNGELRGAAIVSGLPQLEDHALLTKVLAAFLGREIPALPPVAEA